jgi:hypothetical protein
MRTFNCSEFVHFHRRICQQNKNIYVHVYINMCVRVRACVRACVLTSIEGNFSRSKTRLHHLPKVFLFWFINSVTANHFQFVEFEVLTAAVTNVAMLWDLAPCNSYVNRCFGITYHSHLHLPNHLPNTGSLLVSFSTLKMQVTRSSETSVHILTTQSYIPEDVNIPYINFPG